jgi:hypothetical protein
MGRRHFPGQRVLRTWLVNSVWGELWINLGTSDSEYTSAQPQLDEFLQS